MHGKNSPRRGLGRGGLQALEGAGEGRAQEGQVGVLGVELGLMGQGDVERLQFLGLAEHLDHDGRRHRGTGRQVGQELVLAASAGLIEDPGITRVSCGGTMAIPIRG